MRSRSCAHSFQQGSIGSELRSDASAESGERLALIIDLALSHFPRGSFVRPHGADRERHGAGLRFAQATAFTGTSRCDRGLDSHFRSSEAWMVRAKWKFALPLGLNF
ncbi:hypothetical protein ASF57_17480 [Methylobacterium sp. Leaf117]|nr:hypothetical protein ASF57_17480 [Methylobacterium sp. Leaf117]